MKDMTKTIRISSALNDRLKEVCSGKSISQWIVGAINMRLAGKFVCNTTPADIKAAAEDGNLAKTIDDQLAVALKNKRDLFKGMDSETLAKIAVSRLTKNKNDEKEEDKELLSIETCLAALPDRADITSKLNKTLLENARLRTELGINQKALKFDCEFGEKSYLMECVYRLMINYVMELITRESLSGMGDGHGLDENGLKQLCLRVERDVNELSIFRDGDSDMFKKGK